LPVVQSASVEQWPTHAVPVALQVAGAHDVECVVQVPLPLQTCPNSVAPLHVAPSAAHSPRGSAPLWIGVHVPLLPPTPEIAAAHAWHWPVHAVSQQKPSTQKPLAHWSFALHVTALPLAPFATQSLPLHQSLGPQSEFEAQVVLHAVAPQANGTHDVVVVASQPPTPLHTWPFSCVAPEQDCPGHSLSGSIPAAIGPHVPSGIVVPRLAIEHAWQSSVHAVEQQTPSVQYPVVH
jgi:hypothetical protein